MGRVHEVITAAPLGVIARGRLVTALEVETLRPCEAIRATSILSEGTILWNEF